MNGSSPIKVTRDDVYREIAALTTMPALTQWRKKNWGASLAMIYPTSVVTLLGTGATLTGVGGAALGNLGSSAIYRGLTYRNSNSGGGGDQYDSGFSRTFIRLVVPIEIRKWFQKDGRWIGVEMIVRPVWRLVVVTRMAAVGMLGVAGGVVTYAQILRYTQQWEYEQKWRNVVNAQRQTNRRFGYGFLRWFGATPL